MEYLKSVRLQSESFLPSLDEEEELLMTDKQHIACSKNEDSCKKKRDKMVALLTSRNGLLLFKSNLVIMTKIVIVISILKVHFCSSFLFVNVCDFLQMFIMSS